MQKFELLHETKDLRAPHRNNCPQPDSKNLTTAVTVLKTSPLP
jgi:hypothetical protein